MVGVIGTIALILFIAASFVTPFSEDHPRRLGFLEVQVISSNQTINSSYWSITSNDPYKIEDSVKKLEFDQYDCGAHVCNATIPSHLWTDVAKIPSLNFRWRPKNFGEFSFNCHKSSWQEMMIYTKGRILSAQFENETVEYNPVKKELDFPIWKDGKPNSGFLFRFLRPNTSQFTFRVKFEETEPAFSVRSLFWYPLVSSNFQEIVNKTSSLSGHITNAEISNLFLVYDFDQTAD